MAGVTNMMGTLGATFGGRPLAHMVNAYGWQTSCHYLAYFGVFVALCVWLFVRDKKNALVQENLLASLSSIFKIKQMWIIGAIGGVLYLPITAFAELWGVPYLMAVYGIGNEHASQATVMIFVGTAIGSPIFAFIANYFASYKKAIAICAMGSLVLFIVVAQATYFPYAVIFLMLTLIGFMTGGQVLAFSIAKDNSPESMSGTAMGFTNALVSFVGLVFQPLLGSILDFFWGGGVSETGVRTYDIQNYQYAISLLPIALIAVVALLYFTKETYKKISSKQ
jgi:sugar phosphate permease